MKHQNHLKEHSQLLAHLTWFPRKMMSAHDLENVTELVLHELCDEEHFNLEKAAYFIDNPAFNCLKGIAGFSRQERYTCSENIWDNHDLFSSHMSSCAFNQKVRGVNRTSIHQVSSPIAQGVQELANELEVKNPLYYSWPTRYENRGVLIFERSQPLNGLDEHMQNALYLLGFCPFF